MAVGAARPQDLPDWKSTEKTTAKPDTETFLQPQRIPPASPPLLDPSSRTSRKKMPGTPPWNTTHLAPRLAVDATCAAAAATLVAPLITMVDQCVMENASGKRRMAASLRASLHGLLRRPRRFLAARPFRLIALLYAGTYLSANAIDSAHATLRRAPAAATTAGPAKFLATTAANLSLCLYKDAQFTRMFATGPPRPLPPATYALFALRDALTIFASFNLPPLLAPLLPTASPTAAQFLAPAAIQLLSTPLHLLGLDLYNRPAPAVSLAARLRKVRVDWLPSSLARMCRIVPAFGLGGVVNARLRANLMRRLEH